MTRRATLATATFTRLLDVISSNTAAVLQETIKEVAQNGLDGDSQRVKMVVIVDIDEVMKKDDRVDLHRTRNHREDELLPEELAERQGEESMVRFSPAIMLEEASTLLIIQYELVLEELCTDNSCEELHNSTAMYRNVTSHLNAEIFSGGFTWRLQTNAQKCGDACSEIQSAMVDGGEFGKEEIVVQLPRTTAPTAEPSTTPTSLKSGAVAATKASKNGKPKKERSKDAHGSIKRKRKPASENDSMYHLSAEP